MIPYEVMIQAALTARSQAYAPYSKFQVGAALDVEGHLEPIVGCNVENSSYGLSICAERGAIMSAVAAGRLKTALDANDQRLLRVVVAASPLATPCGACRQFLSEFGTDIEILCVDANNLSDRRTWMLHELLPESFHLRKS